VPTSPRLAEALDLGHEDSRIRWLNQRTDSWFNRFRRLLIRWEKKVNNYLAVLSFAAAYTAFRAAKVFG
jgi:hypothetical protein